MRVRRKKGRRIRETEGGRKTERQTKTETGRPKER